MVRIPGMFKNFDELEENLSLEEIEALLTKAREAEHDRMRFAASLKGIDLDKNSGDGLTEEQRFEQVKMKAAALLAGKSEDEYEFETIGFTVTRE